MLAEEEQTAILELHTGMDCSSHFWNDPDAFTTDVRVVGVMHQPYLRRLHERSAVRRSSRRQ